MVKVRPVQSPVEGKGGLRVREEVDGLGGQLNGLQSMGALDGLTRSGLCWRPSLFLSLVVWSSGWLWL